jgi:hypothetical protein
MIKPDVRPKFGSCHFQGLEFNEEMNTLRHLTYKRQLHMEYAKTILEYLGYQERTNLSRKVVMLSFCTRCRITYICVLAHDGLRGQPYPGRAVCALVGQYFEYCIFLPISHLKNMIHAWTLSLSVEKLPFNCEVKVRRNCRLVSPSRLEEQ